MVISHSAALNGFGGVSAGIVLTPATNLLVTIDYYDIKVKNRIGLSKPFDMMQADINNLADLQYVGIGGVVQYFTNGFDTDTKGFDVVGSYPFHVGAGRLTATLAYNYNKTTVPERDPEVISDSRVIDIEHLAPNDRVNLNLDYSIGQIHGSLRQNYYGSWRDDNDYPGQLFSAKSTTDVEFAYDFSKRYTAAIGARNVFNVFPDKAADNPAAGNAVSPTTGSLSNGDVYPRAGGPFGFNGTFWYARVGASF